MMSKGKHQPLPLTRVSTDPSHSRTRHNTSSHTSIKQMLLDFWGGGSSKKSTAITKNMIGSPIVSSSNGAETVTTTTSTSSSEPLNTSTSSPIPKHLQISPSSIRFSSFDIARGDNNNLGPDGKSDGTSLKQQTPEQRRSASMDGDEGSRSMFSYNTQPQQTLNTQSIQESAPINKFLLPDRNNPFGSSLSRFASHQKRYSSDLNSLHGQTPFVSTMSMFGSSTTISTTLPTSSLSTVTSPTSMVAIPTRLDEINKQEQADQEALGLLTSSHEPLSSVDSAKSLHEPDCLIPSPECKLESQDRNHEPKQGNESLNLPVSPSTNAPPIENSENETKPDVILKQAYDRTEDLPTPLLSDSDSPHLTTPSTPCSDSTLFSKIKTESSEIDTSAVSPHQADGILPDQASSQSPKEPSGTESAAPAEAGGSAQSSPSEAEYPGKKVRFANPLITLTIEPEDPDDPKFKKKKKKNAIKRAFRSSSRKTQSAPHKDDASAGLVGSPKKWWKSISGGNTLPRRPDSLMCTSTSISHSASPSTSPTSVSPSTSPPSFHFMPSKGNSSSQSTLTVPPTNKHATTSSSKRNSGLFSLLNSTASTPTQTSAALSSSPPLASSGDEDTLRTMDEKVIKGKHAGLFTLPGTFGRSV